MLDRWKAMSPAAKQEVIAGGVVISFLIAAIIAAGALLVAVVDDNIRQQAAKDAEQSVVMQKLVGKTIRSVSGIGKPITITTEDGTIVTIDAYKYPLLVEIH